MNALSYSLLFVALFVVLVPIYGLIRGINAIAKRQIVPTWLPFALVAALLIGGSWAIDAVGVTAQAKVVAKHDEVTVDPAHGSWQRALSVDVRLGESPGVHFVLHASPRRFDSMQIGERVRIRVLTIGSHLHFARFADDSTFSMLADLLPRTGARAPRERGTGIVTRIDAIESVTFRGRNGPVRTVLRWPYDIVQVRFVPPRRSTGVTLVDRVEHASAPALRVGDRVPIRWLDSDPRTGRIENTRAGSLMKNLAFEFSVHIGATIALFGGLGLWWRGRKRRGANAARSAALK